MDAVGPGEAALLGLLVGPLGERLALDPADEFPDRLLLVGSGRQGEGQGVLRGQAHEGGPEQGVGPGGEHLNEIVAVLDGEMDLSPVGLADPVALHGQHPLRPAGHFVQPLQQLLHVGGDAEEVAGHFALAHLGVAAPAAPLLHLLVGQHGLAAFAPVDQGHLAVDQVPFPHLQEHELFPAVVAGVAGGELPLPVQGVAQLLELAAHVIDIAVGPGGGVGVVRDGGVLGRHAEGVPAHGVQHVVAPHALDPGHHVADGVDPDVAHVDAPAGVGEHLQHVVFGLGLVQGHLEDAGLFPALLPPGFHAGRFVTIWIVVCGLAHGSFR